MAIKGKLIVEFQEDGSIKTNAQQVQGEESEILAELQALASMLGGELKVEKHEPGMHSHSHGRGHVHSY